MSNTMNILAIDTATEACSVALKTEDGTVFSRFEICPQQHSQRLLPMVDEVLAESGRTLASLDLLTYGRGPGSFTGVRIATGMIQGLALGTGHSVVGVSTLAAMAQQQIAATSARFVASAIDARMGEVYFAVYENTNQGLVLVVEEQVCPPETAAELLQSLSIEFDTVGTGWAAYEALGSLTNIDKTSVLYPSAEHMLSLALVANDNGEATKAIDIEPVYLRDKVTWKKLPGRE